MNEGIYRGRIAPTTSGYLHIGHARTFATALKRARAKCGKIILRIEDIDIERCRPKFETSAIDDLHDVGFAWNEGVDVGGEFAPYRQSERLDFYREALLELIKKGLVYPSQVSRAKITQATPQKARKLFSELEDEFIFPQSLREPIFEDAKNNPFRYNWRFRVCAGKLVSFKDNAFGSVEFLAQKDFGDFLVWRKIGVPSYELAVVSDDIAMKITEVVRGADLLVSTARQLLLYRAFGSCAPEFFHCPLTLGEDGKKLSKSTPEKDGRFLIRQNIELAKSFLE